MDIFPDLKVLCKSNINFIYPENQYTNKNKTTSCFRTKYLRRINDRANWGWDNLIP